MTWFSPRFGYIFMPRDKSAFLDWRNTEDGIRQQEQMCTAAFTDEKNLPVLAMQEDTIWFGCYTRPWSACAYDGSVVPLAKFLEGTTREQASDATIVRRLGLCDASSPVTFPSPQDLPAFLETAFTELLPTLPEMFQNPDDWVGPIDFFVCHE